MMVPALFAAAPANDNYSNRFAIVNSPTVVTATLAEATSENYSPAWVEALPYFYNADAPTIWWGSITLTNPASLTVELLESGPYDELNIWHFDLIPYDGGMRRVGDMFGSTGVSSFQNVYKYVTARLTNGYPPLELDVQLAAPFASSGAGSTGRLVARFTIHTNPLILTPPQSRTVSAGESVFFGIHATGHSRLDYQWLHNGELLAGANFPILSLNHVTSSNAGTYRVIVTDDLGTNSDEVTLTVSESNVQPRWHPLTKISTNEWSGLLQSEAGRSYRIESSMTLTNWSPLTNLTQESAMLFGTGGAVSTGGIVFLAKTNSQVRFRAAATQQYFRATRYEAANSECHNNLKMIRFSKDLWITDYKKNSTDSPSDSDIFGTNFFEIHGPKPVCPSGGTYRINVGTLQPQCSVHSPLLEPSW